MRSTATLPSLVEIVRAVSRWLFAIVAAHQLGALFVIIAIEEAGVPLPAPGDLVIAFYGYRARAEPLQLLDIVLVCALASTAGTLVPYAIARRFGRVVALRLARWLEVDGRRVDALVERIEHRGFLTVLVGRLVPGLRVGMSLVAGTARVPVPVFSSAVFLAAVVYWSVWTLLGVLVGPAVLRVIGPAYLRYLVVFIPLVVVILIGVRLYRARRAA